MEESMSDSDGQIEVPTHIVLLISAAYDSDDFPDEDEPECPTCGALLDDNEICYNEECPACGEEPSLGLSDSQLRQHERKQMGIGG